MLALCYTKCVAICARSLSLALHKLAKLRPSDDDVLDHLERKSLRKTDDNKSNYAEKLSKKEAKLLSYRAYELEIFEEASILDPFYN